MTYNITNHAPDADALIVHVFDALGNEIAVTISRVIGGEVHISVTNDMNKTIQRSILGAEDSIMEDYND